MSGIVVQNKVNIKLVGNCLVDPIEEFAKLKRTMASIKLADDLACFGIQCSKQRCGAIARVIMRSALSLPGTHRKDRLGPVQRLDLRLLVDTQNQSLVWRIKVKPHDVANLVDKQRVFGKLEGLGSV